MTIYAETLERFKKNKSCEDLQIDDHGFPGHPTAANPLPSTMASAFLR